jgi:hypothetical protein
MMGWMWHNLSNLWTSDCTLPNHPNVVFLHIPKTAGQSVHSFLVHLFGQSAVAPARVNEQLIQMSIPQIRQYTVFSGHMDWALLDCIESPRFVFTILREPTDRILSFYFYLRSEAQKLTEEELKLPQNEGKWAALNLSCDEYFTSGKAGLRNFLDNHYDNFYTNYFAGRTYDARQRLVGQKRADPAFDDGKILDLALANLSVLNGVYTVDRLDLLENDLRAVAGVPPDGKSLQTLRINVNTTDARDERSRMDRLHDLGATRRTFDRIAAMTALDQRIWDHAAQLVTTKRPCQGVGGQVAAAFL